MQIRWLTLLNWLLWISSKIVSILMSMECVTIIIYKSDVTKRYSLREESNAWDAPTLLARVGNLSPILWSMRWMCTSMFLEKLWYVPRWINGINSRIRWQTMVTKTGYGDLRRWLVSGWTSLWFLLRRRRGRYGASWLRNCILLLVDIHFPDDFLDTYVYAFTNDVQLLGMESFRRWEATKSYYIANDW